MSRLAGPAVSIVACLMAGQALAAQTIPPAAARGHVGQRVTVQGRVQEAYHQGGSGATVMKMDGENGFVAIFYTDSDGLYPDPDDLEGHTVSVTGEIQIDRGQPEMILTSPGQIKIDR
ncbi:MAG TPA: hypothetical protein VMH86_07030 [Rhizomicrobium sp.]|nr:hypothetical protein [Rhizomicrobium sp.]